MELITAKLLAESLMDYHGLNDWTFKFDRAVKRFGQCDYVSKTISLSEHTTKLNPREHVLDTILHEVSHALAGYNAGHGSEWRKIAIRIGANPDRTSDGAVPEAPYRLVCPNCGHSKARYRKTRTRYSCHVCCNKYNGGQFADRFAMQWVDARALSLV